MKPKLFIASERILLTLWVGGMWTAGYLVAPILFNTLEREMAGNIAGRVFGVTSYIGLVCGGLLLLAALYQSGRHWLRQWRIWVILIMLALTAVGQFGLQPQMAALKSQGIAAGSVTAIQFGRLHGIASSLFLVTSLLGLALVIAGTDSNRRRD